MSYDYFTINFPSVSGFIFLLIFLYANASLDKSIKRIFYLLILLEFIEMGTYSIELWTTTFETLSPLRLWLSAVGYAVRPFIFCLILMLALRNTSTRHFSKWFYLPAIINTVTAFSVFFTDVVYSYTPDNQFHRGPLGYVTYVMVILYLIILMVVVVQSHSDRPKLEVLIIFAISFLLFFAMAVEAIYSIRTIGRASIILVTIFYYMFFQSQVYNAFITQEQYLRMQLEHANRLDGSTGVLNKQAFADAVKKILWDKDTKNQSGIGFVFIDLDHLKKLNDTLGHTMGDIAIADAVAAIQATCRKTDLVGRFGGDEFYVMLPNIPRQRFMVYLNDVQAKLQNEYSANGQTVAVSASMGAVYTENIQDLSYEQLVELGDEALYEAKAFGRNCHIVKEL